MAGRFRGVAVIVWGALSATAVFGCATSTQTTVRAHLDEISEVRVESEGDATVVTLVGLNDPVFLAFEEPDPDRIIVDLTDVGSSSVDGPVVVYDGLVEEIAMSPFAAGADETMTRVEISMARPATYEVTNTPAGLRIWLNAAAATGVGSTAVQTNDPWEAEPMAGAFDAPAAVTADEVAAVAVPEIAPATKLVAVEVQEVGDGSLIELGADGTIASAVTFTLQNPDRLVIDLPYLTSEVASSQIKVGSSRIGRIRVGQHADKVRVVVDAGSESQPFEARRVGPGPKGLWVSLGSGSALDAAFEAATAAPPAPTLALAGVTDASAMETGASDLTMLDSDALGTEALEAGSELPSEGSALPEAARSAPTKVYGVEFDVQEERDRVVILGDRPVDYLVYEPDPETFIISIANAEIEPEAAVRIAPEERGPVSLVTAFDQPDVETSEVRIVVKRAEDMKPEISRRGSLLIVDFPHTGSLAAVPPLLETAAAEPILGESAETSLAALPAAGATAQSPASGTIDLDGSTPAGIPLASNAFDSPAGAMPGEAGPASLEPPAAIDILQEGGLIDGKEYTGRRISLDFKDVDIADVLRLIAEVSDLNVIAGDEVAGKVTIRLVDVPWDQALDIILLTKGLGFMRIGNVLRIAPNNVIAQEEEARLQERRAKERLEDLVVKLQPVNYASASDISRMVKELLTERGTVNVDSRTNTLVLKDIPSVIDEATALIKAVDTQTPQVMIEAKIVEAKLQFSREFGSVWSVGIQPLTNAWDDGSPLDEHIGTDFARFRPSQLPGAAGATNGAVFANPITTLPTALANMGAFLLDEKINLDLQLQAAEINGDGKVISSPRVVTLDNSKAKIEQGVSIPFQTFENGDAQLEFVDAVLKLDVTPHITANQAIIMKVKVTRNAPDDSVFTLTGSPAIAKNEVDTETLVKDGQTLVLGGIYTMNKSKRQSRVPYLASIPILGSAFRNNETSDQRQELLIFVTPRIVQSEKAAL